MATYSNGQVPASALRDIPGGARLLAAVSLTWSSICAEVARLYGWTPAPTGTSDAYRALAVQERIFRERYTTTFLAGRPTKVWRGRTYWLKPGQATAATPGASNHGWGCAVDVESLGGFNGTRYRQFAAVAARFGWTNTEGRSINEAWHWVDVGTAYLVSNGLPSIGVVPGAPIVTIPEEINMASWTEAEWVRLDRIILDRVVALVGKVRDDLMARVDQHALNALRTRRPLFVRCNDGRIVADCGNGYRLVTAQEWQVWTNLGRATIDPDLAAMDPVPFAMFVDSLGGLR